MERKEDAGICIFYFSRIQPWRMPDAGGGSAAAYGIYPGSSVFLESSAASSDAFKYGNPSGDIFPFGSPCL